MKRILVIGMGLALMMSLAACGTQDAPASSAAASSASAESAEASSGTGGMAQIGNPYVTCADAAEMQQQAGLEVALPEQLPAWVEETIYRAMPGKLVEVIYQNADNEIRVRAAEGSEDISGVYNSDHSYEAEVTVGENTVHVKGDKAEDGTVTLFVCTWTAEGRTYSVTSANGAAEAEMLAVVEAVR